MERDWTDFKAFYGNIEGARAAFEKACEPLVRTINPNRNVQIMEVKLGDGGIDIYVGEYGVEPITVYQCKFFIDELADAQKSQIRNSFNTAVSNENFALQKWVLCIPKQLNSDEALWWSKWKKKQLVKYGKEEGFIVLMGGSELITLLKLHGLYNTVFRIDDALLLHDIFDMVKNLNDTKAPPKAWLPKIRWARYIGRQRWKNTPLIIGDQVFVGSAGNIWNQSDENDGVYCLDLEKGSIVWFFKTNSDVNEITYLDGLIIGGCDNGKVFCISSRDGKVKWDISLPSGVISRVHKHSFFDQEVLIVVCYNGDIYLLNLIDGGIREIISLGESVISEITVVVEHTTTIFVTTIQGTLIELKEDLETFKLVSKTPIYYIDEHKMDTQLSCAELYGAPLVTENKIFVGLVRQTYYDYPAVVCLDRSSKSVLWYANDSSRTEKHYGNIRTSLKISDGYIILTHPYSNELVGLNSDNGCVEWVVNLGRQMFQQWASPVIGSDGYYLARHDGYLYKVSKDTNQRVWGMYLGENEDSGVVFDSSQELTNENERAAWDLFKGYSLFSTPGINNNELIIGSDEGVLYCIENI